MDPVILATCRHPPVEPADDARLAEALRVAGRPVLIRPWTDLEPAAFQPGSAIILRSVWDYHLRPEKFLTWLDSLADRGVTVLNSPILVRLTMDKSYLTEKRPFGCAAPVTIKVPPTRAAVLHAAVTQNWKRFILKPPVSASAEGIFLVDRNDLPSIDSALRRQPDSILIQEFLPEIREGELSLIFFDGWLSHAVRKIPAPGEFRVQSEFSSRTEPVRPAAPVIASARRALLHLPEMPCYARVDGIMRGDEFLLMELELIEPELFLHHSPGAARVFADAVIRRLPQKSLSAAGGSHPRSSRR